MIDAVAPLDRLADPLAVAPLSRRLDATITPPGSKSVTCRAYVLAALAEGTSRIRRPLAADDTDRLLDALAALGAGVRRDGHDVIIDGVGGRFPGGAVVDLGDGGTPSRFMMAAACLACEPVTVTGSARMRQRPVSELIGLLRALGVAIESVEQAGHLPVRVVPSGEIAGGPLDVGTLRSSQFVSALMLVAPFLRDGLELHFSAEVPSRSYVDLTAEVMRQWNVPASIDGRRLAVRRQAVHAGEYAVPPDASSAVYWWSAAALADGWTVWTPGLVGAPRQPDEAFPRRLEAMGASLLRRAGDGELPGATGVRGGARLAPTAGPIDMSLMPDAALSLAALAAHAEAPTTITGLATLRVKETDRIRALATELAKLGCDVHATDDSLTIDPRRRHDRPVVIETYRDHRMAMAFAILGLARGGVSIGDPACVAKSYPGFWRDLASLY